MQHHLYRDNSLGRVEIYVSRLFALKLFKHIKKRFYKLCCSSLCTFCQNVSFCYLLAERVMTCQRHDGLFVTRNQRLFVSVSGYRYSYKPQSLYTVYQTPYMRCQKPYMHTLQTVYMRFVTMYYQAYMAVRALHITVHVGPYMYSISYLLI